MTKHQRKEYKNPTRLTVLVQISWSDKIVGKHGVTDLIPFEFYRSTRKSVALDIDVCSLRFHAGGM